MQLAESLKDFYKRTGQQIPVELLDDNKSLSHFNVKRRTFLNRITPYNRRDYYKICLAIGSVVHTYGGRETIIDKPAIIFSNPDVHSSILALSEEQSGFYCLFNNAFIQNTIRQDIKYQSPLFNKTLQPVVFLTDQTLAEFTSRFTDMENLLTYNYTFRFDMIRSILQLMILDGIRLQDHQEKDTFTGNERLLNRFLRTLNEQFPVDSPENPLTLNTPAAFADHLNVHINYLNQVVKKALGKTTSAIIHERVITEARALLINTDWDVAEIAYSLGFEYPSHFNKYFKQYEDVTPLYYRESANIRIH